MTKGCRRHCNARLRAHIDQMLRPVPPGRPIITADISRSLSQIHRSYFISPSRTSALLKERDDLRRIGTGRWVKK